MKINKSMVKVHKDTGKRLTLRQTRELKKDGKYDEYVISLAEYEQQQKQEHRKAKKHAKNLQYKEKKRKIQHKRELINYSRGRNVKHSKILYDKMFNEKTVKNKDGNILFDVEGIHTMGNGKLEPRHNVYHFQANQQTFKIYYMQIGALAKVGTRNGFKRIMITNITKPRGDKRIQQTLKFNKLADVYRTTWVDCVQDLIKDGHINPKSRFCNEKVTKYEPKQKSKPKTNQKQ